MVFLLDRNTVFPRYTARDDTTGGIRLPPAVVCLLKILWNKEICMTIATGPSFEAHFTDTKRLSAQPPGATVAAVLMPKEGVKVWGRTVDSPFVPVDARSCEVVEREWICAISRNGRRILYFYYKSTSRWVERRVESTDNDSLFDLYEIMLFKLRGGSGYGAGELCRTK
jgi:hypothetical protein